MRIVNTGTQVRILTYRDGTQLAIPPAGGAVPNYVIRPNSDIDFLDDNALQLQLFSLGVLVLQNDDGSAYTGPALPAQPDAPGYTLPVLGNTKTGALQLENGLPVSAGGGTTSITVQNLIAGKRAGTLTAGTTYATPEGYRYLARSATNFVPIGNAPIISGTQITICGDSFNANAVINSNRQSTLSIPGWTGTLTSQPFEVVANGYRAVAGQSWATINSGQLAAALADPSEVVFVTCGPNVWLQVATSTSVDQAMIDAAVVLDALSAAKQLVVVSNSSPGVSASHVRMFDVGLYNARFAALCARYPNVVLADGYSSLVDPASATGDVLLAATYDNLLHPNMRGAMREGRAHAAAINARTILVGRTATVVAGTPDFTTTGGAKTGGTITGNLPTGMRCNVSSGSAGVTLSAINLTNAASAINQLGVAITNAAGTLTRTDIDLGGASTAFNAGLQAGDTIRGWVGVRFKSFAQLDAFYAYLTVAGGGGTTTFGFSPHTSADLAPNVEVPFSAKIYMPPQILGAGFTSLNLGVGVQLKANAAAAATFDVWGYQIEKVA